MFSQSYNRKHFFLLVKEKTYFSGLGTAYNGLGMVFIHNSFGNNTYNTRQPSCLQLFKRNLTPLLRQTTPAKGSSFGFFFLWKTDHTIVVDERVAKKLRDHFQTNIFFSEYSIFFPVLPPLWYELLHMLHKITIYCSVVYFCNHWISFHLFAFWPYFDCGEF